MIGIVLWSDPNDCKAVFWCEDHGDLAFYNAEFDETDGESVFVAGDMVQFDVFVDAEVRRAVNPNTIIENAYDGLDRRLRSSALTPTKAPANDTGAQILAYRRRGAAVGPTLRRREQ